MSDALTGASILAVAVSVVALALRAIELASATPQEAIDGVPLLFVGACLCSAGLLRRRSQSATWIALIVAAAVSTLEIVGVVRFWRPGAAAGTWPWLVVIAECALVATAGIAAAYAARVRPATEVRWTRLAPSLAWGGFAAVVATAGWAIVVTFLQPSGEPADAPLRLSGRLTAAMVAGAAAVGAWLDLRGPLGRARARSPSVRDLPRAVLDELLPLQPAARRRLREEERARLAADLHALVLPDLRRAASAARAGEAPQPVAADLEQAIAGVEELLNRRQSLVFEQYGLVAALEWLAERTQVRADIDVDLELEGPAVDDLSPIPQEVRRAAFRVALLALDNVVRHAAATRVTVRLTAVPSSLELVVDDDGRGFDPMTAGPGSRGLVDMRAEAIEAGATLRLEPRSPGARVALRWPAGA